MPVIAPIAVAPDLTEQAYQAILDAICDGRFVAGQRITQEALAESLSVSRQPVLQALLLLKRDGLVIDAGGRGVMVAPLTTEQIAKRNLAALSIACGFPDHVGETEELHNIPIFIEVIREMPKDGSAERNQIRGYSAGGAQGANVTPMAKAPSADERRAPVWKSRV